MSQERRIHQCEMVAHATYNDANQFLYDLVKYTSDMISLFQAAPARDPGMQSIKNDLLLRLMAFKAAQAAMANKIRSYCDNQVQNGLQQCKKN